MSPMIAIGRVARVAGPGLRTVCTAACLTRIGVPGKGGRFIASLPFDGAGTDERKRRGTKESIQKT
ncbi:MAG: hypothetical protein ABSC19_09905 [Syntrophorhabdales bacterium]